MILRRGMNSPDVLNLELQIQALGIKGFLADGIFDDKTENAIKYIQRSHNLKEDGVAGALTLGLIKSLLPPVVKTDIVDAESILEKEDDELLEVHPFLLKRILQVKSIAKEEGYHITVTQGLRTFAEQDKLYAQRPRVTKAKGGQSYHNYGVAVDIAFIVAGKISWNADLYQNIGRWASRVGLEWGGHWHFVDYPHLQLNNLPATGTLLPVYRLGGIHTVWSKFIH